MPPMDNDPDQPIINDVWANAQPIGSTEFLTMPSGQTCHARCLGLEGIMAAGLLGDADSLSSYIGKKHVRRVRGGKGVPDSEDVDARSIMKDPESLKRLVFLVDRATPLIVAQPTVLLHFEYMPDGSTRMLAPEERQPGRVYTDMVGLQDKMYLFNYAMGGTRDLERFRSESERLVEDVPDGESVQRAAEPGTPHGGGGKRKRPPRRR